MKEIGKKMSSKKYSNNKQKRKKGKNWNLKDQKKKKIGKLNSDFRNKFKMNLKSIMIRGKIKNKI